MGGLSRDRLMRLLKPADWRGFNFASGELFKHSARASNSQAFLLERFSGNGYYYDNEHFSGNG